MSTLRFGRYRVEVTHPDRILFPEIGLTKAGLIDHYCAVSDAMLPHLRGRPLTLQRFPEGTENDGFYQKQIPESFPEWVARCRFELREPKDGTTHQTQVVCSNQATLALLVQHGCVTPHVWTSRCDLLERPDQLVFDLDPSTDDFDEVRFAARALRELLDEIDLPSFVKTSGSRGLHVHVPLQRELGFDRVRAFANAVASRLVERHPDRLTVAQRKSERGSRLYLDVARNAYGQTIVPPFAVRPRPEAPVACPIWWDEVDDPDLGPRSIRVDHSRERAERQDPWTGFRRHSRSLEGPAETLARL